MLSFTMIDMFTTIGLPLRSDRHITRSMVRQMFLPAR
ncbi:hypothetical protein FHT00_002594 [Sphingomonas insulae]|nr:hypothetical protein [Sphingomonas insulae]